MPKRAAARRQYSRAGERLAKRAAVVLDRVPPACDAASVAAEVRFRLMPPGRADEPLRNFRRLASRGRFEISEETLSAAAGYDEALLIPLDGDRFAICIDPTPRGGWHRIRPHLRTALRRQRFRFRVAHEIGHTLFYDRGGDRPRRLFDGSEREERFCDEFARSLLLPTNAARKCPPTPAAVLRLQQEYDVSLEVAVRAVAAAEPGRQAALWYTQLGEGWRLQWANVKPADPLREGALIMPERGQALVVAPRAR
jgi:hypothetical protein